MGKFLSSRCNEEKRSTAVLDSAKQNLASSFVNAFVNAGFCKVRFVKKFPGCVNCVLGC